MQFSKNKSLPLVGIPCDVNQVGLHAFHGAGEKYINAVIHGAGLCPLLIPAQGPGEDLKPIDENELIATLINRLDGLFLSGSPSNIEPHHYGTEISKTPDSHDPQRDGLTLALIKAAVKAKMPILAVCRGMQELNVALGGSLHQKVHLEENLMDHREDSSLDREGQYAESHHVNLTSGGYLEKLAGCQTIKVNSLHGQGMNQLASGLMVEATAPDGLVEAFKIDDEQHYVVAVQWHPEWQYHKNAFSTALFRSFGDAVLQYATS